MTNRELTSVALKVFAIYILVQVSLALPQSIYSFIYVRDFHEPRLSDFWLWIAGVAAICAALLIALFVWRLSVQVVRHVEHEEVAAPQPHIEPFILSVLGVFLIVQAMVELVYLITSAYIQAANPDNPEGVSTETIAYISGYLLQTIIGVTLVIRAKGWVGLLGRLREAGLSDKSPDNPSEKQQR